jgi:hypothetical protein
MDDKNWFRDGHGMIDEKIEVGQTGGRPKTK